jgi:hypothetical protein
MVAGKQYGKAVSWIVDVGSDFPADVMDTIQTWDTGCVIREDKGRLTTRAWNGYGANEKRGENKASRIYDCMASNIVRIQIPNSETTARAFHALTSANILENFPYGVLLRAMYPYRRGNPSQEKGVAEPQHINPICDKTNIHLGTCSR